MPEKSVREMSALELRHHSIAAKTFHTTLMISIILGLVSLIVGLALYTVSLVRQYISESFNLTRSAATIVKQVVDPVPFSEEVMARYRSLSEEDRAKMGTDEYREFFKGMENDETYQMILTVMMDFYESSDVSYVYFGMYDRDTSALVYIADADQESEYARFPGDWESVERREMERFLAWDGVGRLYDIGNTEFYGWMCTSATPIRNASGEPVAFVLADITLDDVSLGMRAFVLQYFIATVIITLLLAYLTTQHMKKALIQPINAIADAAASYVGDKRSGRKAADHFSSLNIRTGDEVENLSLIMADMEKDLTTYEDDLKKVTAEKERINLELTLANRIQADMLPNIFPAFPDREDFDVFASMRPAKEVGGDFYDFFLIDPDHLALVMADVSGKGVPAALFMMASKILVSNFTIAGKSPGEVLETVNEQICSNNREEMFVMVWLGILDLKTGKLTASNAGHECPMLMQPGGQYEIIRRKHGFIIGGMSGMKYSEYELQLKPGSKLFLYTDGLVEATNSDNELFGTDRTLDVLNKYPDATPEETLPLMDQAVKAFVGKAPQFDDLTMLCISYTGQKGASKKKS